MDNQASPSSRYINESLSGATKPTTQQVEKLQKLSRRCPTEASRPPPLLCPLKPAENTNSSVNRSTYLCTQFLYTYIPAQHLGCASRDFPPCFAGASWRGTTALASCSTHARGLGASSASLPKSKRSPCPAQWCCSGFWLVQGDAINSPAHFAELLGCHQGGREGTVVLVCSAGNKHHCATCFVPNSIF